MKKLLGTALAATMLFGLAGTASAGDPPAEAKICTACHTFDQGGAKKMGPNLFGIYGKEAGKAEGFKYSDDFMAAFHGKTWDDATLDMWIADSKKVAKKSTMNSKVPKAEARTAIIEYLKSLK